jgi:hypothetical protein
MTTNLSLANQIRSDWFTLFTADDLSTSLAVSQRNDLQTVEGKTHSFVLHRDMRSLILWG